MSRRAHHEHPARRARGAFGVLSAAAGGGGAAQLALRKVRQPALGRRGASATEQRAVSLGARKAAGSPDREMAEAWLRRVGAAVGAAVGLALLRRRLDHTSSSALPVVDLAAAPDVAAKLMREHVSKTGFFYLVGHGVSQARRPTMTAPLTGPFRRRSPIVL